jgi:hypothetical protein
VQDTILGAEDASANKGWRSGEICSRNSSLPFSPRNKRYSWRCVPKGYVAQLGEAGEGFGSSRERIGVSERSKVPKSQGLQVPLERRVIMQPTSRAPP